MQTAEKVSIRIGDAEISVPIKNAVHIHLGETIDVTELADTDTAAPVFRFKPEEVPQPKIGEPYDDGIYAAERLWPKVSAAEAKREGRADRRAFTDIRCHPERLQQPLKMRKSRRIFVNSMSDLFHEDVPEEFIDKVFAIMATAKGHTFQVLTKRPERMRAYLEQVSDEKDMNRWACAAVEVSGSPCAAHGIDDCEWPLRNVWLGVSVEDQATADERIPLLLATPAAVRWISAEPLLGPVDLNAVRFMKGTALTVGDEGGHEYVGSRRQMLHWVVTGGESGPKARPMHPDWARSLRDQCAAAGVPFLFKQWGEWAPGECGPQPMTGAEPVASYWAGKWSYSRQTVAQSQHTHVDDEPDVYRFGKKAAGRTLDGVVHDEYPCDAARQELGAQ